VRQQIAQLVVGVGRRRVQAHGLLCKVTHMCGYTTKVSAEL
jgi:hypothetical protein